MIPQRSADAIQPVGAGEKRCNQTHVLPLSEGLHYGMTRLCAVMSQRRGQRRDEWIGKSMKRFSFLRNVTPQSEFVMRSGDGAAREHHEGACPRRHRSPHESCPFHRDFDSCIIPPIQGKAAPGMDLRGPVVRKHRIFRKIRLVRGRFGFG